MKRVLVVEDDEDSRYMLSTLLRSRGDEVVEADNGAEALVKARQAPPDLVISDILMPGMDGFAFCREWKADPLLKNSPFVFYTGTYTDLVDQKLAMNLGADGFIIKPTEPEEFLAQIGHVLVLAEEGRVAPPGQPAVETETTLRLYNDVLVRKLEHKTLQLERANKSLEETAREQSRMGEALRKSEDLFRAAFDNAVIGKGLVAPDGTFIEVNRAFCEMLGYEAAELTGRSIESLTHLDDAALSADAIRDLVAGERDASSFEKRYLHKDGHTVWALVNTTLRRDEAGKPLYFISDYVDLTERKQAEEALRESEERYRRLAENAPDIVFRFELLPERRLSYVNQAVTHLTGYPPEEWYANPGLAIEIISPDDADQLRADFVAPAQLETATRKLVRKDGSIAWIEQRNVPVFDEAGTLVAVEGIIHDVTEGKAAEDALARLVQQHALVLNSAAEGILGVDLNGRHTFVNASAGALLGYSPDELIGLYSHSVWHHTKADGTPYPAEECLIYAALRNGIPIHVSSEVFWRSDGTSFPADYACTPMYDLGRLVGAVVTFTDMTEQKRDRAERETLQAQLQQAQKMESVGRLAGGVAHDFNNMLGVILGRSELAMAELGPNDPRLVDLKEIRNAAQSSATLTRQLLAFARKDTVAPVVLDLNEAVAKLLGMMRRLIGEGIDLAWQPGTSLWPVRMDPGQVDQLLANLSVNARDAITSVGTITIATARASLNEADCARHPGLVPGKFVRLTVSDNGSGMDEETLAQIFEPFFTTKGVGEGTGLGLATVYGIVAQNKGAIEVESEPGKGTTFTIYLPRYEGETASPPSHTAVKAGMIGGKLVLVVEDNPSMLALSKIMLERQGYAVLAASTPAEAIRLAEGHSSEIDLLMTDVIMPEMNGRDLAEQLQSRRPTLKCLFVSGYTADIIARQGVLDAQVNFLQKPFTMERLAAKVREALDEV